MPATAERPKRKYQKGTEGIHRVCPECQQVFPVHYPSDEKKYCSPACQNPSPRKRNLRCAYCQGPIKRRYQPTNSYCSRSCSNLRRHEAARKERENFEKTKTAQIAV